LALPVPVLVAVAAAAEPGARFGMRASSRGGAFDDEDDKDDDEDDDDEDNEDDDEKLSTTDAMVTSAAAVMLASPDADAWIACVLPEETPVASSIPLDIDDDCNADSDVSDDG
jgi:hypothetical protein